LKDAAEIQLNEKKTYLNIDTNLKNIIKAALIHIVVYGRRE